MELITVAKYLDEFAADMAKLHLEKNAIPVSIAGRAFRGAVRCRVPFELQVQKELAQRAIELLKNFENQAK